MKASEFIFEEDAIPDMLDGKPTRNSNGKYIHNTIEGIKNFWKWFGDSKVVDKLGRPFVMYHGTASSFDEFSIKKAKDSEGRKLNMGWGKDKFYFTRYGSNANSSATFASMTKRGNQPNIMPVYLKSESIITSEKYMDMVAEIINKGKSRDQAIAHVDKFIKKHGVDGIISDTDFDGFAVFSPNQIKSAIGNKGGYSATSSNITENISKDTIWYHASDIPDIINFDDTKLRNEKFGHFFTDDPETVKGIYGDHVYERTIDITNPYVISQDKWNSIRDQHHGDSGYFKQLRDSIISKGHDSLLVKTRNIQFGRFDIREPNIIIVFDASKIKPVVSKITEALDATLDDQLKKYKKELEYMITKGKLPKTAPSNYTNDKRYEYYYAVEDKIKELTQLIQAKNEQRAAHVPNKLFDNPKFKAWFKGSKVVDDMGDPLPVYHGTNADIQEFNHAFNASSSGNSQYGAGFYFTTNPKVASSYADDRKDNPVVYKVFLNIKKPIEEGTNKKLPADMVRRILLLSPTLEDSLSNYGDVEYEGKAKVMREAVLNFYEYQGDGMLRMLYSINNDFFDGHDAEFTAAVTQVTGYDGIHVKLNDTEHWIAFHSWQIKSVTGNKEGTYSKKSGNIGESQLKETLDNRLTRAEEMGFDTSKVWWHGSFSNFNEFDANRSGSSSFHFSSQKEFAEDYAHTKATDMGSDEDVYVRGFYLPKNLFDFKNPDHIQQLEKVLPNEISIQGRYGWAAFGGAVTVSKDELIEKMQGIQTPYTGIDESQKEKIRNGAEYFSREGSNEKVINYDAVNDVLEWVPGWEYSDVQNIKNNIKWAVQNFGEDDFRVRQYELELKNKEAKMKVRRLELSPAKRDGFDNWHLMEAPELKPYFKKLGFEGALMMERKKLNVAVFDSNRIRSVNAEFNPKFKKSSDILA